MVQAMTDNSKVDQYLERRLALLDETDPAALAAASPTEG